MRGRLISKAQEHATLAHLISPKGLDPDNRSNQVCAMRLSGTVIIALFLNLAWGERTCDQRLETFIDPTIGAAALRHFSDCGAFEELPDALNTVKESEGFDEETRGLRLAVTLEDRRNCNTIALKDLPQEEASHQAWLAACLNSTNMSTVTTLAESSESVTNILEQTAAILKMFSDTTQAVLEPPSDYPALRTVLPAILGCQVNSTKAYPQWKPSLVHWITQDPLSMGRMLYVISQAVVDTPNKFELIMSILGLREKTTQELLWPLLEHAALLAPVTSPPSPILQKRMDIIGDEIYRRILDNATPNSLETFKVIMNKIKAYLSPPPPTNIQVALVTTKLPLSIVQEGHNLPPPPEFPTTSVTEEGVKMGNLPPPPEFSTTGVTEEGVEMENLPPPPEFPTTGVTEEDVKMENLPPPLPTGGPPPPPPPPLPQSPTFKVPASKIRTDGGTKVNIVGNTRLPDPPPTIGDVQEQTQGQVDGRSALLESIRNSKKKNQRTTSQIDRDLQKLRKKDLGAGKPTPKGGKPTGESLVDMLQTAMQSTNIKFGNASIHREQSPQREFSSRRRTSSEWH